MTTGLAFRRAALADAPHLLTIRHSAIAVSAPRGMPAAKAEAWAASLTLSGMEQKLRDHEIWIAEASGTPPRAVAWGGMQGNHLTSLYVLPEHAGTGIGAALLAMLEDIMRSQSHREARTDASENAESFYLRRGYVRNGAPTSDGGLPMIKSLKP